MRRHIMRGLVVLATIAVMAACSGNGSSDPSPRSSPHNEVDVRFATAMVLHHDQAIEMTRMAISQAKSGRVINLAEQIEGDQGREVDTMRGWCRTWKQPVPEMPRSSMPGMTSMPRMPAMPRMPGVKHNMIGMMSDGDMHTLGSASGSQFDTLWLAMMIKHHQGAITMANAELDRGRNEPAKTLARHVIETQQTEIDTMHALLTRLTN